MLSHQDLNNIDDIILHDDFVHVRYKFKGSRKKFKYKIKRAQYENLRILPIIEYCKIIYPNETGIENNT